LITFRIFGLPMAVLFTVMMFAFHFIPNIGALVVVVATLAVGVASKGAGPGFGAVAVLALLTAVIGNVVEPLMMSRTLSLSPLTVVLGLLLWGWLWGAMGALISIPLMLIVKVALEQTRLAWLGELMGEKPKTEPWVERLRARGHHPQHPPHPRPSS
jgi:predicted PurR-regulated permease PerM